VVLGLLALLAASAGPAAASCAAPVADVLADQPRVLLGRVVAERPGFAQLDVEEVWRGPATGPLVWLQTGTDPPGWPASLLDQGAGSSVDADLTTGRRYVVGLFEDFRTNSCLVAGADVPATVDRLRPSATRPPVAGGTDGADPPLDPRVSTGLTVVAAGTLLAGGVWLLRRRPSG
jgi:hypothetical protein